MKSTCAVSCLLIATSALMLTAGCGAGNAPERGYVSGTVTLDGKPLAGAQVLFDPVKGGRPSGAITNEEGYYELTYSNSAMGALLGKHEVRIRTYQAPIPTSTDPAKRAGTPEKVPARYNAQSELTETVEAGEQTIDFELNSDGKIVRPAMSPPVKGEGSGTASP